MYMESVNQQCRELVQLILSTSHCKFYGAHMCSHAQKTISLAPIRLFTKQIVPFVVSRIVDLKFVEIIFTSFSYVPYKVLSSGSSIKAFLRKRFFFVSLFHFHCIHFMGLWELREPLKFFFKLSFYTYVRTFTFHSFLNGFQLNLHQHFSYLSCLNQICTYVFVKGYYTAGL